MPGLATHEIEATVTGLGADGDGIVRYDGISLFVPQALPGERVRVKAGGRVATLTDVLQPSTERVTPPCGLFGECGGCVLQHMSRAAMSAFKLGLVQDALTQAGFDLPPRIGFAASAPGSRRRVDLALRRTPTRMLIGLNRRGRDEVVDLDECHVLEPRLFGLIAALRPVLLRLGCLRATGSLILNLLDSGLDLLLATDVPPDTADHTRLADLARAYGIARIAWRPRLPEDAQSETICALGPVRHRLSGATISPPPGAFLQATADGERAIVEAVLDGLAAKMHRHARIIELYAGCGTLSFALAGRASVSAFEGRKDAAACLRTGAAAGMRLQATQRDLTRQPLLAREFARAAAIVLDPPFAGAGPQMAEIARASVPRVILVSCNPRALGKDASLLRQAGYRLEKLTVIDQFLWSASVESVAMFVKRQGSALEPLKA